jgi:hypothetical protein
MQFNKKTYSRIYILHNILVSLRVRSLLACRANNREMFLATQKRLVHVFELWAKAVEQEGGVVWRG